jgi:hypothetical protein
MGFLVSDVLSDFTGIFNNVSSTKQLELFNATHAAIGKHVKLYPDDVVPVPLVSGLPTSPFDQHILRVWQAHCYTGASTYSVLDEMSVDEKDYESIGWRGESTGVPNEWMDEGPMIRFYPTPNSSTPTLAVSGATNASTIVITCAAHGLTSANDGTPANAVSIAGVVGNTNANCSGYAKITGYSTTTFGLFLDQALTIPVAGNAGYTSGGAVTTPASYPVVLLYCQKRRVLATTDYLPLQVDDYDAWTDMMAFQWARRKHRDRIPEFGQLARQSLNALSWKVMGRAARLKPNASYDVPVIRH